MTRQKHCLHELPVPNYTAATEQALKKQLQARYLAPEQYRIYWSKPKQTWVAAPKTMYFIVDITNNRMFCRPHRAGKRPSTLRITLASGTPANFLWVDLKSIKTSKPLEQISSDYRFMDRGAAYSTLSKLEQFAKFRISNRLETTSPQVIVMQAAQLRAYVAKLFCSKGD